MAIQDLSVRRTPYNSLNWDASQPTMTELPKPKEPNRKSLAMKENWRKRRAKEAEAK